VSRRALNLVMAAVCGVLLAVQAAAARDGAAVRAASAPGVPVATDARLGGDETKTRFIVDLSQKIDMRAFTLADPNRVVIDLPQVNFQLPANAGEHGRGLVKAFRFGLVMQGGSRIVLDVTRPVRVEKAFVLDPADGQPARLVLDLIPVDRQTFLRAVAIDNYLPRNEPHKDEHEARHDNDPRPIIVLDPGHGGIDNGTRAPSGESEKDIVLAFALMLRDKLEKTGKYRVVMTRSDDTYIPLAERVRIGRRRQAQLFISIHCDALPAHEGAAQGASVYTVSEHASDAEAARLAEAENKADVIAGVDLTAEPGDIADILIDLAQRETKTFSTQFAHGLVNELKLIARLHKHPVKSAGFRVLMAPDVPSVLVELGYVSNKDDLRLLMSEVWRGRATDSMLHAIDTYFARRLAGAGPGGGQN
jgi:N-acetylmuramoyl-L-alanine amidase